MGRLIKIGNAARFAYMLKDPKKTEEALLAASARLQKVEYLLKTIVSDSFTMEHLPDQTRAMVTSICGDFGIVIPKKEP
jgi:hypothetical protein